MKELFDPGIDNLPMPVDGIEPDLEMLSQREQLMEDIDCIVDEFFTACCGDDYDGEEKDTLTKFLCDAVCKNFPVK